MSQISDFMCATILAAICFSVLLILKKWHRCGGLLLKCLRKAGGEYASRDVSRTPSPLTASAAQLDLTPHVQRYVHEKRKKSMLSMQRFILQLIAIMSMTVSLSIYAKHAKGLDKPVTTIGFLAIYLVNCAIFFVCKKSWSSWHVERRLLDVAYAIEMLHFVGVHWGLPTNSDFRPAFLMGRMALSIMNKDVPQAVFWNTVCSGTFCFAVMWEDSTQSTLDGWTDDRHGQAILISSEALSFFFLIHITATYKRLAYAEAYSAVEAKASMAQQGASTSVLNAVCDVVFKLDATLNIKGPCPKLAAMLLTDQSDDGNHLVGSSFIDFLALEDDRTRFADHLQANRNNETAAALSVRVRDRTGNTFQVQVYHICHETLEGTSAYLIGLSEAGDAYSAAVLEGERALSRMTEWNIFPLNPLHAEAASPTDEAREGQPRRQSSRDEVLSDKASRDGGNKSDWGDDRQSRHSGKKVMLGTPPARIRQCLLSGSDTRSDVDTWSSVTRGRNSKPVVVPGLAETTIYAKELTLLSTTMTWNFQARKGCCYYHATMAEVSSLTKLLATRNCNSHFLPPDLGLQQCSECKVLERSDAPSYCTICQALGKSVNKKDTMGGPRCSSSLQGSANQDAPESQGADAAALKNVLKL